MKPRKTPPTGGLVAVVWHALFVASSFALGVFIGRRCAGSQLLLGEEKNGNNMLEALRTYAESLEEFEELQGISQPCEIPHDALLIGNTCEAIDPSDIRKTLKRGIQDFGVSGDVVAPDGAVRLAGWQKGLHDFDMGGAD